MLLSSTYEPTDAQTAGGTQPERMTDSQVRDEVLTIFLAGYETVANALTWTWYLLSQHPEVEAKLHAELDNVLAVGNRQITNASPPWPTTPAFATRNKSSPNPCASIRPRGPWAHVHPRGSPRPLQITRRRARLLQANTS